MKDCANNLGVFSTVQRCGDSITVYQCGKFQKCVLAASELKTARLPSVATCEGCESFKARTRPDFLACSNRGESTGKKLNCQCGVDKNIYRCSVHGECLKRLPPAKSVEDFGAALDGVAICSTCPDVA